MLQLVIILVILLLAAKQPAKFLECPAYGLGRITDLSALVLLLTVVCSRRWLVVSGG